MKTVAAVLVLALLLIPGVAMAGSEDAALALGAFAVFNQIISGTGIFGAPAVIAPRPVVVAPQPVYVAPPPPVYAAPAPVYVAPRPVVVAPAPVYVAPRPVVVYRSYGPYHRAGYGHWKHAGHRGYRH